MRGFKGRRGAPAVEVTDARNGCKKRAKQDVRSKVVNPGVAHVYGDVVFVGQGVRNRLDVLVLRKDPLCHQVERRLSTHLVKLPSRDSYDTYLDTGTLIDREYLKSGRSRFGDNRISVPRSSLCAEFVGQLECVQSSVLRNGEGGIGELQIDGSGEDPVVDFTKSGVFVAEEVLERRASRFQD